MFYTARACARTHTQVTALRGDVRRHVGRAFKTSLSCADPTGPTETYPGDSVETSLVAALARGAGERGSGGSWVGVRVNHLLVGLAPL